MKIIAVIKMTQLLGLRENGKELQFKAFEFAELFERKKQQELKKMVSYLLLVFFLFYLLER